MLKIIKVDAVDQRVADHIKRSHDIRPTMIPRVERILEAVRERGDAALLDLTERYDNVRLTTLRVDPGAIEAALQKVKTEDPALYEALRISADRIRIFHEAQIAKLDLTTDDLEKEVEQIRRPLRRVGAYVPGGQANYPSTVLMTALIAKVAGVAEVIVVTPPMRSGAVSDAVLTACSIAGVDEVYSIGGAQAIAALAYGTETITRVDKIVGPGNLYVTLAKKMVIDEVAIDMLAGPSEVLVIADANANARFVAADLLAQAEHAQDAIPVLITNSEELAHRVKEEIVAYADTSDRKVIIEGNLITNGVAYVVPDLTLAVDLANLIAPEHLGIYVEDYAPLVKNIDSAGAMFIGNYSPQAIGDYCAGPSHVLPTGASARYSSPLSVEDFLKRTSIIHLKKETFDELAGVAATIARAEGLSAHKNAIDIRLDQNKE